jgi:hypothetical protein
MATPQHTLNLARPPDSNHFADLIRRRLIEYRIEHGDYKPEEAWGLCRDYQEAGGNRGAFAKMAGWSEES